MSPNPSASPPPTDRQAELGWYGRDPNAPDIVAKRDYLTANSRLAGLEIHDPTEFERAVRIFRRDGVVDVMVKPLLQG